MAEKHCPFCGEPAVRESVYGTTFRCGTQRPIDGDYSTGHVCDITSWARLLQKKDFEIDRLRLKAVELGERVVRQGDKIERLEAERNALLEDVGRVSRIRQEQAAEIERLCKEVDYQRCMHAKVDSECAVLKGENERITGRDAFRCETIDGLRARIRELEAKIELLTAELEQYHDRERRMAGN